MVSVGILPYSSDYCNDKLFDLSSPLNRDNSLQAWHDFQETCLSDGWDVRTCNNGCDASFDAYLVLDPRAEKLKVLGKDRLKRTIVQFSEPPDIVPEQYNNENLDYIARNCPKVFCFNGQVCQKYGFSHRPWYVDLYPRRQDYVEHAEHRDGICMIATNKYNPHPLSELDFRLNFVKALIEHPEFVEHFSLYGRNWLSAVGVLRRLMPKGGVQRLRAVDKILLRLERQIPWNSHLNVIYRGTVDSKCDILARAKFYIIIENTYWDGWLTEKLFDALQFGCVPIYYGAGDVLNYVPPSVFINGKSFSAPADVLKFALNMTSRELDDMIQKGQQWLRSEEFDRKFGRPAYINTLKESIAAVVDV
jgi:hypothetical protein